MMTIIVLCLAYALVKFVPDYSDAPVVKRYGCDDPAVWRRELHGPDLHVIDGGGGHE